MVIFWSLLASSCLLLWYAGDALHPWRRRRLLVYAAIATVLMFFAFAVHAEPVDWKAVVAQCYHRGETDPRVCPPGTNCPGWQWVAACAAVHYAPSAPTQAKFKWCLNAVEEKRAQTRAPASTGAAAIEQTLRCGGIVQ